MVIRCPQHQKEILNPVWLNFNLQFPQPILSAKIATKENWPWRLTKPLHALPSKENFCIPPWNWALRSALDRPTVVYYRWNSWLSVTTENAGNRPMHMNEFVNWHCWNEHTAMLQHGKIIRNHPWSKVRIAITSHNQVCFLWPGRLN
jgi:hypothetical protein